MPIANYTPLAGKYGQISWGVTTLPLVEWSVSVEGDVVDTSAFNGTSDADGNITEEFVIGLLKSEIKIKGKMNHYPNMVPTGPTVNLRPNQSATVKLGYSPSLYFLFTARVVSVDGSANVREAGEIEAVIRATSHPTYPRTL